MTHNKTFTDAERELIREAYNCVMKGAQTTLKVDRDKLHKRADEIKARLGIRKLKDVIDFSGNLKV